MPKTVVILDETPDSQRLGVAMLGAIGELVDSVQFVAVAELPAVADPKAIYCPLTLDVPPTLNFGVDRSVDLAKKSTDSATLPPLQPMSKSAMVEICGCL
ncbi:MAG: hypothetical protein HC778_06415 [Chamaesiphon sp. CSU_1_12]|nr:hypothetical protein [Chamaesiphon sp. CSU_1_12]